MNRLWNALKNPVRAFGALLIAAIAKTVLRKVDPNERILDALEGVKDDAAPDCGLVYETVAAGPRVCTRRPGHPGPHGQAGIHVGRERFE